MKAPNQQLAKWPSAKSGIYTSSRMMAISCVLAFMLGCGAEKTDIEYIESAKSLSASGDTKSYAIELKNALQRNPQNSEARFLLGQYYADNQLGAPAEKELEKAIEYGMKPAEVVLELTKAFYYQYAFSRLLEYSDTIPAISADDKAEILFYRGASWINLGNIEKAQVEFEASVNVAPESVYGKVSQGYLYLIFDKPTTTKEIAESLTTTAPENAEVFLLLARSQLALKQPTESASSMEKALSLQPNRLQLYVDTARVQISAQKFAEAEKNVDHVLKLAPKHLPSNILKATLRLRDKDFEAAREHADQALTLSEVNKQAKLISGMANFYLENWESARDRLMSIQDFVKPGHVSQRMLAYAEFKLGYAQTANEIISTMGDLSNADSRLLKGFGAEFARKGKLNEASSLFETAAGLNTDDADSLTKLGILKLTQDDASGLADLEKALEKDGDSTWARAALARYYLKTGETTKSVQIVEELLKLAPDNVDSYLLAAEIYANLTDYDKASNVLDKALSISKENPSVLIMKSKLAFAKGDLEQTNSYLQQAIAAAPSHEYALMAYYRLNKSTDGKDDAIKAIDNAIKLSPDNDKLKFLRVMYLTDERKNNEAVATLSLINSSSPLYPRAQDLAANIELRSGNKDKALTHYQNWISADKRDYRPYLAAARILTSQNDLRKALSTIDDGLNESPSNQGLLRARIKLLLDNDQVNQANQAASKYNSNFGKDATIEMILGSFYAKKEDYKKAKAHLQDSFDLTPTSRALIGLAELDIRTKNVDAAIKKLDQWISEHPDDQAVRLYKANLALSENGRADKQEAVKQYTAMIETNPNNYVALNNLAWVLGEVGRINDAVSHAAKAYQLKPELPAIVDTYGYLLLISGNVDEALGILQQAYSASNNNPSIAYHYAMALSQNGKKSEAKTLLSKLEKEDFPEKSAAAELFKTL